MHYAAVKFRLEKVNRRPGGFISGPSRTLSQSLTRVWLFLIHHDAYQLARAILCACMRAYNRTPGAG